MHKLKAITALGGQDLRVETIGALTLRENPNVAMASVHARLGQEDAARQTLRTYLDADAPMTGKAVFADRYSAFWTAQNQWMLCASYDTDELLALDAAARFKSCASVTEQSDAWCCFDLTGQGITAVMELLCPINMRQFQLGDVARTSIHHLGCFVLNLPDEDSLRVFGPRASAETIFHALKTAMNAGL